MNIFYLDKCPVKAAQVQYNKHVVKMILESAQMLCTAHHVLDNRVRLLDDIPYKIAHVNHPSTIWVRENSLHYDWQYEHMIALGNEYTKRYGKTHLSYTKCKDKVNMLPGGMLETGLTEMPQCMPDEYKDKCSVQAYWNYYIGEKHTVANPNKEKIYDRRTETKN